MQHAKGFHIDCVIATINKGGLAPPYNWVI